MRLLGDAQVLCLIAGGNEFTTIPAIGKHSRRYSVNRTALKSRLGRLQLHNWGVVVGILPQIGRVSSNRHKVFESTASASVESILRQEARRMEQGVPMPNQLRDCAAGCE